MTFKGTGHFRQKVDQRTHVLSRSKGVSTRVGAYKITSREYREDILSLCERVDQLQEVADAARALISASNLGQGDYVTLVRTMGLTRLEAALGALQTEGGGEG